jgi:AcrR family transcriptional regulator
MVRVANTIAPDGSLRHDGCMGRPKNFSREGVLKKALSVFWKHGFADTSLQELERATGVNKSGLYSEFEGKEDLFVQSLQYYLEVQQKRGLLTAEPLGWNNVERFLKLGLCNTKEQKGCFSISSMREFPILPSKAFEIVTQSRLKLKEFIANNIEVERPKMAPHLLAELVLTFFTGLCMEQYGKSSRTDLVRKVDNVMKAIRGM